MQSLPTYAMGLGMFVRALNPRYNTPMDRSSDNSTDEKARADEIAFLTKGGKRAAARLFSKYRDRLARMVDFRLDPRLHGRVDGADVLQEAFIEVARRLDYYLGHPDVSFFVWTRQITMQTVLTIHRRHLAQKRDVGQEVSLRLPAGCNTTSASLSHRLVAQMTPPSRAAVRQEEHTRLREALDSMDEVDREVLALRHFEQLDNGEVAQVLGLGKTAASNRYVRALKRLRDILAEMPAFRDDTRWGQGSAP